MNHISNNMVLALAIALIVVGTIGAIFVDSNPVIEVPDRTYLNTVSEGQMIYESGASKNGPIPFLNGPMWLNRSGGGCVVCHGRDGRGGIIPMMAAEATPAITYESLTKEGFTTKKIKRAIVVGLDEKGKKLEWPMPKWAMTDQELNALIKYLKKLDE